MIEERIQTSIRFGIDAMKAWIEAGLLEGPTEEHIVAMARFVTNDYNVTYNDYIDWMIECPLPPS